METPQAPEARVASPAAVAVAVEALKARPVPQGRVAFSLQDKSSWSATSKGSAVSALWECPDCGLQIQRNPDDPLSEEWTRARIAACEDVHAQQLAEHDGDREALRLHLRNPGLAHAIKIAQSRQ